MFGVIASETYLSEKNICIFDELNEQVKEKEAILFYLNLSSKVTYHDFAIMNITEINNAYGWNMAATCLMTADILKKAPVRCNKAYYIWDLSFLLVPYEFNSVYETLSGLQLVVRSEDHQRHIKNIFNLDSKIVPFFRLDEIWNTQ